MNKHRQELHTELKKLGLIRNLSELDNPPSPSVAAVDGGQVVEKSLGADIVMAVAVGVEGLVREDQRKWLGVQYKNWQNALSHHSESNPKIARGAMTALELSIISNAPHDVIIADGSHQTPVIGINSLTSMSSLDEPNHAEIMLDIIHKLDVIASLKKSMESPNVVYLVKYDSSQDIGVQNYIAQREEIDLLKINPYLISCTSQYMLGQSKKLRYKATLLLLAFIDKSRLLRLLLSA